MKPDFPGEWYNRAGRRVMVWDYNGLRCWRDVFGQQAGASVGADTIPGDDWLPAVAPVFPVLPPPPPQVFAETDFHGPDWWALREGKWAVTFNDCKGSRDSYTSRWEYLKVIPHPDNDPEAVRLLEEAANA